MAQNRGAMAKDPSANLKRVSPGVYRNAQGNLVNSSGRALNSAGHAVKPPPPTQQATPGNTGPTPEQMAQQSMQQGAQAYQDIFNRFQNSDPYQMQAQYNPAFTTEMDRQRQNIMGTFNRRNAEEFQRQDIATEQQIVERGLDPASPAAEALRKANTQRQDLARQEAMSAGETAALGAQQQYYQQAYQTAMAPYAQFEYLQQPYTLGLTNYYQGQQLSQQQKFEASQQAKQLASQERIARMRGSGGGGGGAGVDPMNSFYDQQAQQGFGQQGNQVMSPGTAFAQGATTGVGTRLINQR